MPHSAADWIGIALCYLLVSLGFLFRTIEKYDDLWPEITGKFVLSLLWPAFLLLKLGVWAAATRLENL